MCWVPESKDDHSTLETRQREKRADMTRSSQVSLLGVPQRQEFARRAQRPAQGVVSSTDPGMDLVGASGKCRKDKRVHVNRKAGVEWTGSSDGEATAPCLSYLICTVE